MRCDLNRIFRGLCVFALVLFAFGAANAQNFQGIYVGAVGGGNNGNSDAHTFTVFSPTGYFALSSVPAIATVGNQHLSPSGGSGGGTFGFNLQQHWLVYGAEMDFSAMNMSASKTGTATYPCCAPTSFTITQKINTDWLFTGRARLGVASGNFLVYGTAGLAATNFQYSAVFTDTFATAHENAGTDEKRKGWVGGAGAEVRLNHHWSVKGEYLRADFGQSQTTSTNLTAFTPPIAFPSNKFTHNADLTANIYRGGLNYRF
ncbi:MAG TPA: outer membrane beta-barrel protein [Candidatus Angelobacter sp.]|nr:outer membrane beta-barrel protein [Candidatus Angelobacter sp.]